VVISKSENSIDMETYRRVVEKKLRPEIVTRN
jgi:hypothetical protein